MAFILKIKIGTKNTNNLSAIDEASPNELNLIMASCKGLV